jgi:hypothetical protein
MTMLSEQIIQLYSEGKTYSQIKETLNCSKGTISYHLGEGQKAKTRSRTKDKKDYIKRYLQEYKQGKPCADCREEYPYFVLDFDHIGSDKLFDISQYRVHTTDINKLKDEMAKCELVCANCHRMRTHIRANTVGSNSMNLYGFYNKA